MKSAFFRSRYYSKISAAALLGACLPGLSGTALAEVVIKETFDDRPIGLVAHRSGDPVVPWEGPKAREYGSFSIVDDQPRPGSGSIGHGQILSICDASPDKDKAPTLQFRWADRPVSAGHLSLSWDFLVPVDTPYLAIQFIGKNWEDSAAIVLLSEGRILVQSDKGVPSRVQIGTYETGKWCSLRFDLDVSARTFDAYLNKKKVLSGYAWQTTAAGEPKVFSTVADLAAVERKGAPVLYLDNVEVSVSR